MASAVHVALLRRLYPDMEGSGSAARDKFWQAANGTGVVKQLGQRVHRISLSKCDWTGRVQETNIMPLKMSVSKFVQFAKRFGHEDTDYSSLASTLVIHGASMTCGDQDKLHDIVLNIACVCEKAGKATLKRFYHMLRRHQGKQRRLAFTLKSMAELEVQAHNAYGPFATFKDWDFRRFIEALAREHTRLDFGAHADLFAVLLQACSGCQSAGPVAGKTIIYKVSLYCRFFNNEAAKSTRWYMFNLRNGFLTDSSNKSSMNHAPARGLQLIC